MPDSESSNGQADERPESPLEDFGRRAGRFAAALFARTREEVEDVWAEAQSIRKGERD